MSRLVPLKIRYRSSLMDCEASKIVCYRQFSPCGNYMAQARKVRDVREKMREHKATCPDCKRQ